jgi:hypothetical protein
MVVVQYFSPLTFLNLVPIGSPVREGVRNNLGIKVADTSWVKQGKNEQIDDWSVPCSVQFGLWATDQLLQGRVFLV